MYSVPATQLRRALACRVAASRIGSPIVAPQAMRIAGGLVSSRSLRHFSAQPSQTPSLDKNPVTSATDTSASADKSASASTSVPASDASDASPRVDDSPPPPPPLSPDLPWYWSLSDLAVGILFGAAAYNAAEFVFAFPEPAPTAISVAEKSPRVVEALGQPLSRGYAWKGTVTADWADLLIPVSGPLGEVSFARARVSIHTG